MTNVLAEILANKREEVERAKTARPLHALTSMPGFAMARRDFYGAVAAPRGSGPNLIAEIKRASPSAGTIRADFDPVDLARQLAVAGADALSVLTDERYFDGRLEFIEQIKAAVGLPVLRKDFLIDAYQLYESRAFGADAVLLIAEALEMTRLVELVGLADELELCVLLEVHERETLLNVLPRLAGQRRRQNAKRKLAPFAVREFRAANGVLFPTSATGGRRYSLLIGINNRDLNTQRLDLATTERLAPLVPPGLPIVAESGVTTRRDVQRLHAARARALLVGETLMRSADPAHAIRALFGELCP